MRFDRPITYNGWTASLTRAAGGRPSSGYIVDSVEPSRVGASGYIDKRAIQDGLDANDVFLGGRDFGAVVTAYGSTWGDFWDKTQDLLAAFSPTLAYAADSANAGFLAFDFIQPTADITTWPTATYPYGIPMRYYLRPVSPPSYTLKRDEVGGDESQGLSHRFDISLIARDPRKYLQDLTTKTITSATQTVTYRGDYPTFPIFSVTMSAVGGASPLTIVVDGYSVAIDMSAQSTGTYELNYATRQFTKSGVSYNGLITSAVFTDIGPGSTYQRLNPTGTSVSTFSYREAFA